MKDFNFNIVKLHTKTAAFKYELHLQYSVHLYLVKAEKILHYLSYLSDSDVVYLIYFLPPLIKTVTLKI